jgi:hypothetical protein
MTNDNTNQSKNKLAQTLISGIIVACFMAYLAIPSVVLGGVNIALFILCAYKICKKSANFTLILAVTALMFIMMPISSLARLISLIVSASAGGAMLYEGKTSRTVFIAFSVAVYALATAVTKSPIGSLAVFSAFLPAVALAVSSHKKATRVSAICATSAAFLIMSLIPIVLLAYSEFGTDIKGFIDSARADFTSGLSDMLNQTFNSLGQDYADIAVTAKIEPVAELVFVLMPAMYIISANVMAFSSSYLHVIIRQSLGKSPNRQEVVFLLSSVSAWVYVISFLCIILSLGDSDAMYVFLVSMGNINLILTPSFALVGILSFMVSTRVNGGKPNIFKIVIIVLSFIYCGAVLLYPLAAMGVITTLRVNKRLRGTRNS